MLGKPSIDNFVALKGQRKIVCLTAYSAPMANVLDPHCDLLLVGDSVGMVVYGMDTTQNVDLNTMIRHGQAVMRRRKFQQHRLITNVYIPLNELNVITPNSE